MVRASLHENQKEETLNFRRSQGLKSRERRNLTLQGLKEYKNGKMM